jgi:hypothetical protein
MPSTIRHSKFYYIAGMKKYLLPLSFLFCFLASCTGSSSEKNEQQASESDLDAARNFIRAALDGDYNKAKQFVVDDSTNKQSLDLYEWNYKNNLSADDKKAYQAASIRMLKDIRRLNDSVTIIPYSNSYKDKEDSLKVIRKNGKWMVDLNFTFQKNDSIPK